MFLCLVEVVTILLLFVKGSYISCFIRDRAIIEMIAYIVGNVTCNKIFNRTVCDQEFTIGCKIDKLKI